MNDDRARHTGMSLWVFEMDNLDRRQDLGRKDCGL